MHDDLCGTRLLVNECLWLTGEVTINLLELLPVLDLMGTQNQYLGKVCVPLCCMPCSSVPACGHYMMICDVRAMLLSSRSSGQTAHAGEQLFAA
jgi:hypothetical protein